MVNTFFQQQVNNDISPAQFMFDVIFGIVVPIVSVAIDWRLGSFITDSMLFSYIPVSIGILVLTLWLFLSKYIRSIWNGFISGILLSSALYACVLAIFTIYLAIWVLFLSSALGGFNLEMVGLSVLAFMPAITAFVYIRNGFRAFLQARNQTSKLRVNSSFLVSVITMFLLVILGIAYKG